MALNVGELFGLLSLDDSPFNEALKSAERNFESASKKMVSVGKEMTAKVTAPILGVAAAGLKMSADFGDSLNKIGSIADKNVKPINEFEEEIKNLSSETGIAASEIGEAVYQMISATGDTKNAMKNVEIATLAAKGGFSDTATAVDGLTSVMNAYGMEGEEAMLKVADLMIQTQNEGKTTFDELSKSLYNVIPVAASLGVGFEEVSAAMASITAQGTPTSVATTQLRQLFVELSKAGGQAAMKFEKIAGKSFQEFIESGGGVQEALALMEEYANKNDVALKDLFSSVEAGNAALQLTGKGAEKFKDALDSMNNSAGQTKKAAEQMEQGVGEDMRKAFNDLKLAAMEVGDVVAPTVQEIAKFVKRLTKSFQGLNPSTQETIVKVGLLAAAIGPLLIGMGLASSAISNMIKLYGLMNFKILKLIATKAIEKAETLYLMALYAKDAVLKGASAAATGVMTVAQYAYNVAAAIGTTITTALGAAIAFLTSPIGIAIVAITAIIGIIVLLYKNSETARDIINGVGRAIAQTFINMFEAIKQIAIGFMNYIGGYLKVIKGLFTGDFELIKEGVIQIFESMWDMLGGIVKLAWNSLSGPLESLGVDIEGWFDGLVGKAKRWGRNMIDGFADGIRDKINTVKNAVSGVMNKVGGWIGFNSPSEEGPGRNIVKWGSNMIDGFLDGVNKMQPNIANKMNEVMKGIQPKLNPKVRVQTQDSGMSAMLKQLGEINVGSNEQPIINVYLGNEQFNDYVVKTANRGLYQLKKTNARSKGVLTR